MKIRYIRDWSNGNTNGANNNWNEVYAYDYDNVNVALGKTVTPSKTGTNDPSIVTDGNDNVSFSFAGLGNVTIDLGNVYDIDKIKIRRYFPSGNSTTQYHETKTEVSVNCQDWITVFDCNVNGKYYETSEGKIIKLRKEIDKLTSSSSLNNVKSKFLEVNEMLNNYKQNLVTNLTNLGVSNVANYLSFYDLINLIKSIEIGKKVIAGSTYVLVTEQSTMSESTSSSFVLKYTFDMFVKGSVRIECVLSSSSGNGFYKFELVSKDGTIKFAKEEYNVSTVNLTLDIENVDYLDKIKIYAKNGAGYWCKISNLTIKVGGVE